MKKALRSMNDFLKLIQQKALVIKNERIKEMKKRTTLQDAIATVVKKLSPIRVKEITWILNNSRLYEKRDLSEIQQSQVYARISKYPHMFYLDENKYVCLK